MCLWIMAGWVAVVALVRLMRGQRDRLIAKLRAEMAEQQRQAEEERQNQLAAARAKNRGRVA
jgi:hypothetical protein